MRCPNCGHEYEFTHICPGFPGTASPQALEPELELAQRKAPWTPWVSGINGLVFGPVAAGLVAFINLRRLGHPRKASFVLAGTAVGSLFLLWVFIYLEEYFVSGGQEFLESVVAHGITPWLFWYLQRKEFKEWDAVNPAIDADSGWKSAGWGVLGLTAYYLLAILLLMNR